MLFFAAASLLSSIGTLSSHATTLDERAVTRAADTSDSSHAKASRASTTPEKEVPESVSAADWSGIRAAYETSRHAAIPVDGGYQARNPGQQWRTSFDARGFTTQPDAGEWTWGLELLRYGFAEAEQTVTTASGISADAQRVTRRWNAALEEWYVNDARGLEHGYTVHERPLRDSRSEPGRLTFTLAVRGELCPEVQADGRGVRFVNSVGATVLSYAGLTVFDADGRVLNARFEHVVEGLSLCIDERGARYPLTIDPTAQQAYLKASNTQSGDEFGMSVSVSGDTVVVAARGEDSNATGVNGNQSDNSATQAGAAYVFVRTGTTWSQQAYLKAPNSEMADWFGGSVSVSGDTVVVGADAEDSNATGVNGNPADNGALNAGAAYIFVRSGTTWSQEAYLKGSNTESWDRFGGAVSVSGDTVVVGAVSESSNATGVDGNQGDNSASGSGAAYVFVRSGTTWSQQAYLKASNTGVGDSFGTSVSVSGDTVVIGTEKEDSNATGVDGNQADNSALESGAAYVFARSGTNWNQQAYLKASNTEAGDHFGAFGSVSVSGDTVVVGASGEDSNATGVDGNQGDNSTSFAGAAYIFVRNATTWSQQAYLKASNTHAGGQSSDEFGNVVSVSGDKVVVGAWGESSNATGVNGNQSDNSAGTSGAVYLFVRSGTTWSQQAYLKASNTGVNDYFGRSVSVSGDTVVVGAFGEDGNATGVNANQGDNNALDAGAAYVFDLASPLKTFCSGDGSLPTACPCVAPNTVPNPPAAPGHGCANSQNLNGALLSASGTLSPETLQFTAFVSSNYLSFGLLLKGDANAPGGIASSDGVRCVDGQLIRFGAHFAGTNGAPQGYWTYPNTVQTNPVSVQTAQTPGQTAYYQFFYRNTAPNFCTSATTNWSNGVQVDWP
jgi:hypothetical protein